MKICNTCEEELILDAFGRDKSRADNLMARCRNCENKVRRDRRIEQKKREKFKGTSAKQAAKYPREDSLVGWSGSDEIYC